MDSIGGFGMMQDQAPQRPRLAVICAMSGLPPFLGLSTQKAPSVRRESAMLVPKLIANAVGCFSLMLAIASHPLTDDMVCYVRREGLLWLFSRKDDWYRLTITRGRGKREEGRTRRCGLFTQTKVVIEENKRCAEVGSERSDGYSGTRFTSGRQECTDERTRTSAGEKR